MIKFSNVSLIYPQSTKTILEDLTCEIEEGEMVLVMGHTGSGKSSLLRLINGLVPHHTGGILAGNITVDGISTREVKPGALAHLVGIVGQNPINGFVTDIVEEELAFGMEALNFPADVMRKRIEEVLDLLSLNAVRDRSIRTLSGGEQQRVAIAAALVMHPKVLVLDEPTSALDPIAAEEVLSVLHRLVHDLSVTVIIAEHRLERVIQFVDRIILIEGDGETSIGSADEILQKADLVPPIIRLARALNLSEIGRSVREVRRLTSDVRERILPAPVPAPNSKPTVIDVDSVVVTYEKKDALKKVSTAIKAGEIVALMGRNGAGKSSLLETIVGVASPQSGSVTVNGINPTSLQGRNRRTAIGYVPQEPSDLLYLQSVGQECESADRENGIETGSTFQFLNRLVPNISADTHPHDLSEGQRLALVLSIVLSSNPRVLILDEPTRGLDYQAKALFSLALQEFATKFDSPVLLATHDVELVAELADRVIFLAEGEIVADGSTLDVLLSSPAFAPQVAKVMSPQPWLTVDDVVSALDI
ncbi:COG1123 ATPase components of various ABC-type transport systems, contain duplicated ATPase [Candidatus Nanopelagicaceae bacterium]